MILNFLCLSLLIIINNEFIFFFFIEDFNLIFIIDLQMILLCLLSFSDAIYEWRMSLRRHLWTHFRSFANYKHDCIGNRKRFTLFAFGKAKNYSSRFDSNEYPSRRAWNAKSNYLFYLILGYHFIC